MQWNVFKSASCYHSVWCRACSGLVVLSLTGCFRTYCLYHTWCYGGLQVDDLYWYEPFCPHTIATHWGGLVSCPRLMAYSCWLWLSSNWQFYKLPDKRPPMTFILPATGLRYTFPQIRASCVSNIFLALHLFQKYIAVLCLEHLFQKYIAVLCLKYGSSDDATWSPPCHCSHGKNALWATFMKESLYCNSAIPQIYGV